MLQLLDASVEVEGHCGLLLAWLGQQDEPDGVDRCPTLVELRGHEEVSVVEVAYKQVEVGVRGVPASVQQREDARIPASALPDGVTQRLDAQEAVAITMAMIQDQRRQLEEEEVVVVGFAVAVALLVE